MISNALNGLSNPQKSLVYPTNGGLSVIKG